MSNKRIIKIGSEDAHISDQIPKINEMASGINDFLSNITGEIITAPQVEMYMYPSSTNSSIGAARAVLGFKDWLGFFDFNQPDKLFVNMSVVQANNSAYGVYDVPRLESVLAHESFHRYSFLRSLPDHIEQNRHSKISEASANFFRAAFDTRNDSGANRQASIASTVLGGGYSCMLSYFTLNSKLRRGNGSIIETANLGKYSSNAFAIEVFKQNDFDIKRTTNELLRLDSGEDEALSLEEGSKYADMGATVRQVTLEYEKVLAKSAIVGAAGGAASYEIFSSIAPKDIFVLPFSAIFGLWSFKIAFTIQTPSYLVTSTDKR